MSKLNILNYEPSELTEIVTSLGEKQFRAKQIFSWLHKGVDSFNEMKIIPLKLRTDLDERYYIGLPEVIVKQQSAKDGTIKCLYQFQDGARVESVFMKYKYGNSICISSQVGCRMGCKFCASTMSGLERNLTSGEILGEILKMKDITGEDINHVVIMGMGEPLDNYDEVTKFIRLVHNENGYNLGLRNITISTCGLIPQIKDFLKEFPQVNLAVSLHAPNDAIRQKTMPIANKYSFQDLIKCCKEYTQITGRRITFEYSMIDGVNDSEDNAKELSHSLKGWLSHVNLIPLNEVKGRDYNAAKKDRIIRFKEILESNGITVTIRRTLGADIDAACGQLKQR